MPASSGFTKMRLAGALSTALVLVITSAGHVAASYQLPDVQLRAGNQVPGCVTPERLMKFLRSRNGQFAPRYAKVARHYERFGQLLGLRWDIAFFQMMVETGNLSFRRPDGSSADVSPADNNFAGLGAVGDGRPGERFGSIEEGIRAHLEHVLHYAGVTIPDPVADRTRKVQSWGTLAAWHRNFQRPITFGDVASRWAPHTGAYRQSIANLLHRYRETYCDGRPQQVAAPYRTSKDVEIGDAWQRIQPVPPLETRAVAKRRSRPHLSSRPAQHASAIMPTILNSLSAVSETPKPSFSKPPQSLGAGRIAASAMRPPPLPTAGPVRFARLVPHALPKKPSKAIRPPVQRRITANDRVRQMIADRKVLLRTHVGTVIPIVYRSNGRMSGEAGTLGFFLGASQDRGRWWISKGKLCQKWRVWLDRETHCMTLKERGGKVWWRADDGKSGTARIVAR